MRHTSCSCTCEAACTVESPFHYIQEYIHMRLNTTHTLPNTASAPEARPQVFTRPPLWHATEDDVDAVLALGSPPVCTRSPTMFPHAIRYLSFAPVPLAHHGTS
jgi:hypothetical protein